MIHPSYVLAACLLFSALPARAAPNSAFDYANQPKNAPFRRSKLVDLSTFIIDRSIDTYAHQLDLRPLRTLGRKDHVLDLGAGNLTAALGLARGTWRTDEQIAPAVRSLYRHLRQNTPHVTAITAEKYDDQAASVDNWSAWGSVDRAAVTGVARLTPRVGRYFEELRADRLVKKHGKFAFVMDLHGVLRYSSQTDQVGAKLAAIMKPGAQLAWKANTLQGATVDGRAVGMLMNEYLIASGAFSAVTSQKVTAAKAATSSNRPILHEFSDSIESRRHFLRSYSARSQLAATS